MVVVNVGEKKYYLHNALKANVDYAYPKVLTGKYKFIGVVDGRSGYGKTTLVTQLAYYLSKGTLTLDDYCFNKKQVLERMNNAKPGDNIIIDEAFSVANKRTSRGQENMDFLADLQKMRIKKIFLWIILPSIYDLDKNVILSFADMFIHVFGKPFGEKGNFVSYDIEGIKKLYLYCRQTLDYNKNLAAPNFYGDFTAAFPLDEEAYDRKKRESKAFEENVRPHKYLVQRNNMIKFAYDRGIKVTDIARLTEMEEIGIYEILKKFKQSGQTET